MPTLPFQLSIILAILIALAPAVTAAAPIVLSAQPASEWNAKFAGQNGWIGGDGVYSVELGDGRILWLFGDTLVGAVKEGRRAGAVMVNNTIAIQAGLKHDADLRFVTGTDGDRSRGSAVLTDGQFTYIYGYIDKTKAMGSKHLTVARAPGGKLQDFASWQYNSANGWSDSPADAAPLAEGMAPEFSVTHLPGGRGFVLVYTQNGLGDRIVGRFSDRPQGPWSAPVLLYKCPEMGTDKGVFTYAANAHAWAAAEDELLISYCANSWEFARLFKDEKVYRPKFVRVKMGVAR